MLKSKKGTVIYWTIFALATAMVLIIYATLSPSKQTEYKGEIQLSLLKAGYIAENKLIYADMAALFSANHAAVTLAGNGGFYSNFPCGNFSGYAIWNNENGSCVLSSENITLNFFRMINEDLAAYMDNAPFKGETEWLTPDISVLTDYSRIIYDLSARGTRLMGTANNALELVVSLRGDKAAAYYTKPSFNVDISYNISEYDLLVSKANLLVAKCRANENTLNCIKGNMPMGWELREDLVGRGGIFAFDAYSDYKINTKQIVYRFALYFPEV